MPDASTLRLALAQINPTVGDVEGNTRLASESIAAATAAGAQLVVLPELCLSGYPPEDLVLRRDFLDSIGDALHSLAAEVEGITALVGFPERIDRPEEPRRNPIIDAVAPPAHNSLAVLAGGEVTAVYRKTPPAELRDLRRAPLLRARSRAARDRRRRRRGRAHDLRGHLDRAARPSPTRPPRAPA